MLKALLSLIFGVFRFVVLTLADAVVGLAKLLFWSGVVTAISEASNGPNQRR